MCVEVTQQQLNKMEIPTASPANKKVSYSIKKLLKQLFKQQKSQKLIQLQNLENSKKAESLNSLESLENNRNANIPSVECQDNDINERLSAKVTSYELEDYDFSHVNTIVPVHFISTEHGTFFWTSSNDMPADNDLAEPLYCSTYNQLACMQDRWAQA